MSEYSRRNLVCSSWHKAPEGWWGWGGNMTGATQRPFCEKGVGHAGDHAANIYKSENGYPVSAGPSAEHDTLTWPNTLGIPEWLIDTTIHGLRMYREHVYVEDQTECARLDTVLYPVVEALTERLPPI